MDLAVHIREPGQGESYRIREHLMGFYEPADTLEWKLFPELDQPVDRIYIGDEYCSNRLPTLTELEALLQFAGASKKKVTLLTPPLTNGELDACSSLFDCLKAENPATEVVFNDWGMLLFLKAKYPALRLAAGRLLDKGFKDPRLPDADKLSSISGETDALLNTSAFDNAGFQEKMVELGVSRLEQDMFPYSRRRPGAPHCLPNLETSVYFPFGYITTGRVCWMATFDEQRAERMFLPSRGCSRACNTAPLRLSNEDLSFPVIQSGNCVYYLYTPAMLASLMEAAKGRKLRLVYQGFAL